MYENENVSLWERKNKTKEIMTSTINNVTIVC